MFGTAKEPPRLSNDKKKQLREEVRPERGETGGKEAFLPATQSPAHQQQITVFTSSTMQLSKHTHTLSHAARA
jgi:hypothetical protein